MRVVAIRGGVGLYPARQARRGLVRRGRVWYGPAWPVEAGEVWWRRVRHGGMRFGVAGLAVRDKVCRGRDGRGPVGRRGSDW